MVYAPFSLAVARLHFIARLARAHLSALVGGRAGLTARPFIYNVLWPIGRAPPPWNARAARLYRAQASWQRLTARCPRLRSASPSGRLRTARGSAAFGVFACLRSPTFGISSLRVSRCQPVSTHYGAKSLARLTRFARETCSLGNTIFPPAFGGTKNLLRPSLRSGLRNRVAFLRLRSCPPLTTYAKTGVVNGLPRGLARLQR